MERVRGSMALLGWTLGLVVLLVALDRAGGGALAGPDLGDPGTWEDWAASRPPAHAAMAVVRLTAACLAWYLLAVTVIAVAVRLGRGGHLIGVVDVITLPFVRRLVQGGVGLGLAGAVLAAAGAAAPSGAPRPTAADMALIVAEPAEDETPVLRRLDGAPAPVPETTPLAPTWTVAPGQHFWSIAEQLLEASGRSTSDAEVAPVWDDLVERNRDRLADPRNPDLLFPGQVLVVPDLSPIR